MKDRIFFPSVNCLGCYGVRLISLAEYSVITTTVSINANVHILMAAPSKRR
jgi:hypothetical protein